MPAYMSYQRYTLSLAFAMLVVMPIAFGVAPPTPLPIRLIVGDTHACEISRNAAYRVSPAFSPSSWLPRFSTTPPMLHRRAGEFGGPQRSLYVRPDSPSTWKYSHGGLPVVRHTSVAARPAGSGKRLSIAFTPPCSGVSKSPSTTGPAPVSIVMSSRSTAPRVNEL